MNPIDELRAARPAHLGDRPVDDGVRTAELARAMSGPREKRRRRKIVRPAWGLGLLGLAGATAVAVAVVVPGSVPELPRTPRPSSLAVTSAAPQVTLSAREVLLAAAEQADRQSDGSGGYWHSVSVGRTLYVAEEGGYLVVDRQRSEGWTPRAPGGEQWGRSQRLGAEPATEADREAWEQAGAPSRIRVHVPAKGKFRPLALSTSEGKASTSRSPLVDGDKVFWLGRNVTMKDLRGLPSEPDQLKKWLMASYRGHGTEAESEEMSGDVWLFKVSVGLIMDMPVKPEVRGAAFRMLASLDDVRVTQGVTDAEGRKGTAVSIEERYPAGGVSENRLVFDEATGRGLASEQVVVEPGGFQAGFEPGAVWASQALIEAGWTDERPLSAS